MSTPIDFEIAECELAPHQQRVVEEKRVLDGNLAKLQDFIASPAFEGVPEVEQRRLHKQVSVMKLFSEVLGERIYWFISQAKAAQAA